MPVSSQLFCNLGPCTLGLGAGRFFSSVTHGWGPATRRLLLVISLQVKRAMTMTEKILANHSENTSVKPGDNIWTRVDKLMTHDVCGPGTFGIFQKEFGPNAQVWDNERVVIIPDHYIFTSDARANRNVDILRCAR